MTVAGSPHDPAYWKGHHYALTSSVVEDLVKALDEMQDKADVFLSIIAESVEMGMDGALERAEMMGRLVGDFTNARRQSHLVLEAYKKAVEGQDAH